LKTILAILKTNQEINQKLEDLEDSNDLEDNAGEEEVENFDHVETDVNNQSVVESEEVENEDRDLILWNPAMRMQAFFHSPITVLENEYKPGSTNLPAYEAEVDAFEADDFNQLLRSLYKPRPLAIEYEGKNLLWGAVEYFWKIKNLYF